MNHAENPAKPSKFEDRFRLYLDESGDHVFRDTDEISHRFLCLLGCWFQNPDYLLFHRSLEQFKSEVIGHHPDEGLILHREDIINRRKSFKILQDESVRKTFDEGLLNLIDKASFMLAAVVIDKKALRESYGEHTAHPYHLAMGFMLQRFAGYLNHVNRTGDVMAEARGGSEDRRLGESYTRVFERGIWRTDASFFQNALSSRQLKMKQKSANISGLQLADLLGHPVKQFVLQQYNFISGDQVGGFARKLQPIFLKKFNRQLYEDRVEGYGYVMYPKK